MLFERRSDIMNKLDFIHSRAMADKAINNFLGILEGITSDGKIEDNEIRAMDQWLTENAWFAEVPQICDMTYMISNALKDGIITDEERQDILWLAKNMPLSYDCVATGIQALHGVMEGALIDGVLGDDEIRNINEWLNDHDDLTGLYPYDELQSMMTSILKDGVIDDTERKTLMRFFIEFSNESVTNLTKEQIKELKSEIRIEGICAVAPEITFDSTTFCFTGESKKASRDDFRNIIESLKCRSVQNVSKKVNYLIVGNEGSPYWKFSCYGRKIQNAIDLRKEGHQIQIVNELDFWDALNDIQ